MTLEEYYRQRLTEKLLSEMNFKNIKRNIATFTAIGGLAAAGGAGLGAVAPLVGKASAKMHEVLGNPVGGVEVAKARQNAANKVGLFGSDVPVGKRALHGAIGGVGLSAGPVLAGIIANRVNRRRNNKSKNNNGIKKNPK